MTAVVRSSSTKPASSRPHSRPMEPPSSDRVALSPLSSTRNHSPLRRRTCCARAVRSTRMGWVGARRSRRTNQNPCASWSCFLLDPRPPFTAQARASATKRLGPARSWSNRGAGGGGTTMTSKSETSSTRRPLRTCPVERLTNSHNSQPYDSVTSATATHFLISDTGLPTEAAQGQEACFPPPCQKGSARQTSPLNAKRLQHSLGAALWLLCAGAHCREGAAMTRAQHRSCCTAPSAQRGRRPRRNRGGVRSA